MTDRPLVSIGVPVRNGAEYLAEALDSALSQAYTPLEIVVSDNASIDATRAIVERISARNPRVRYTRTDRDIGAVANFRRVLDQARGTYFTWLAHDDVLADRQYLCTLVGYLERNPDVVCVGSDRLFLHHELIGYAAPRVSAPLFSPDRPWPEARRDLFRWPPVRNGALIYGLYRREALVQVPIVTRPYRGRPNSAFWEFPVLAHASGHGRFVSLSDTTRTFRLLRTSDGLSILERHSGFDLLMLSLRARLFLVGCALTLPVPFAERWRLLGITARNLFASDTEQSIDFRRHAAIEGEVAMLEQTTDERLRLIDTLQHEIEQRRQLACTLRGGPDRGDDDIPASSQGLKTASPDPRDRVLPPSTDGLPPRAGLLDFFRPPSAWHVTRWYELRARYGELQALCDHRLASIEALHAEAESLLHEIEALHALAQRPG